MNASWDQYCEWQAKGYSCKPSLEEHIVALERELESARQVSMLKDADRLRLQAERDEAHAAIRWLMARFHPYVNVPIEHAPAIRRAFERQNESKSS